MNSTKLTLLSAEKLKHYYASGFWQQDTIYDIARHNAERIPDHYAVRECHRRITYKQLIDAADDLANALANSGMRQGQNIAICLPSRIETVIIFLACSRNGYACCPSFHRKQTVTEVLSLLKRIRVAAVFCEEGYCSDTGGMDLFTELEQLPDLCKVYRLLSLAQLNPKDGVFENVFSSATDNTATAPKKTNPDAIVYLALTSGTTGKAKGVMHSDNTLLANARAISTDWNFTDQSVINTLGPLSHNLGFGAMVTALLVGAELVLNTRDNSQSLVDNLLETRTTFIYGVPTHAIELLKEIRERQNEDYSSIEGLRISGAAVPGHVVAGLIKYEITVQTGYGMTEACSHNYTLPNDGLDRVLNTVGRACPGYEIKIWSQDDNDIEVKVGETGQIGGRGASLMLGYYDDQIATDESFNSSGWFITGDLGKLDENGYLTVTGRVKDLIIRGAHNIFPGRIEELAMRHDKIERAAAVPVADERLGEKVCLVIEPNKGKIKTPYKILEHLDSEGLSKYDMPEYIAQVDDMPLTSSGKILKRDLLSSIEQGLLTLEPIRWQSSN